MEQHRSGKRRPEQWFRFGGWLFDIDQAQALLSEQPREPQQLPVMPWVRQYGLDLLDEPGHVPLLGIGPDFDRGYALTADLSEPLIVATLHSDEHGDSSLLIDGTHRLYRAYREGTTQLPAYVLNVAESLAIRVDRQQRR
jgi:hypothetical protein